MAVKDYYQTLGVDRDVNEADLKTAYRKLALEYHPDRNPDNPEAEEKFKAISEAHSVLSDPEKRRMYDATGSATGQQMGGFRTTGDPFDLFSQFGMRHDAGPKQPRPLRGQNFQHVVSVPLYDSLFGSEYRFEFQVASGCDICEGEGGTEFEDCGQCEGRGVFIRQSANMITQSACPACGGRAKKVTKVCDKCTGRGMVEEHKNLNVGIPAGIHNGAMMRLQGQGGRGVHGGPTGDLMLKIDVQYPDTANYTEEEKSQLKELLSKYENTSP